MRHNPREAILKLRSGSRTTSIKRERGQNSRATIMYELDQHQIEAVSGGILPVLAIVGVGLLLSGCAHTKHTRREDDAPER